MSDDRRRAMGPAPAEPDPGDTLPLGSGGAPPPAGAPLPFAPAGSRPPESPLPFAQTSYAPAGSRPPEPSLPYASTSYAPAGSRPPEPSLPYASTSYAAAGSQPPGERSAAPRVSHAHTPPVAAGSRPAQQLPYAATVTPQLGGDTADMLPPASRHGSAARSNRPSDPPPDATLDLPESDRVAEALPLDPGQKLGRFVIRKRLGEGGMGVVLAGVDADLGRSVAIKLVRTDVDRPAYRARLLREAQAMALLEHPNVVRVYEVGSDRGRLFVAMELVDGVTLAAWMRGRRPPWREVLAMFLQVGAGLAAAHRAGLVHRDFKPDNVLIDKEGRARVADFGLARLDPDQSGSGAGVPVFAGALTKSGVMMGTPGYMAPEQQVGAAVDARADQFSYCIALREALLGGRTVKLDRAAWRHVPRAVRAIVERGLAYEPEGRFSSMDELLAALRRIERRRSTAATAAIAAVAIAGGITTTAVLMTRTRGERANTTPAASTVPIAAADPAAVATPGAPGAPSPAAPAGAPGAPPSAVPAGIPGAAPPPTSAAVPPGVPGASGAASSESGGALAVAPPGAVSIASPSPAQPAAADRAATVERSGTRAASQVRTAPPAPSPAAPSARAAITSPAPSSGSAAPPASWAGSGTALPTAPAGAPPLPPVQRALRLPEAWPSHPGHLAVVAAAVADLGYDGFDANITTTEIDQLSGVEQVIGKVKLAMLERRSGRCGVAVPLWNEARQALPAGVASIAPWRARAAIGLGLCALVAGRPDEANQLALAGWVDGNQDEIRLIMAIVFYEKGEMQTAQAMLNQSRQHGTPPVRAAVQTWLARTGLTLP